MYSFTNHKNKLNPTTLRYPGGTIAMYWDWRTGKFLENDFSLSSETWTLKNYSNSDIEPTTLEVLKSAVDNTCAFPIFDLNVVTSDKYYQLAQLYHAASLNLPVKYVELGNEIYSNKLHSIRNKYPTGTDYGNEMVDWINLIKANAITGSQGHFPDIEIALVGAVRNAGHLVDNPERYSWIDDVLSTISPGGNNQYGIDALILHPYDGSGLNTSAIYDQNINIDCVLGTPYLGIIINLFNDEVNQILSNNSDFNIWHTEYNLFDKDSRATGSWAHALFVAYQSLLYLEEPNITHANIHAILGNSSWGSIFTNSNGLQFGSAIQPQDCSGNLPPNASNYPLTNQYSLTPSGQSMQMIMRAAKNANQSKKVEFNIPSTSGVQPLACNGNNYPAIYGWSFESPVPGGSNMQTILLNFTDIDVVIDLGTDFQNPNTIESIWTNEYDHYFTGEDENDCYDADGWTGGRPGCECLYNKDNLAITNNQITLKPYSINRIYTDACGPVKITSATDAICEGTTLGLQANVLPDVNNYNYNWSGPNGFTANTPNISVTPQLTQGTTVAETYTLTISNAGSGCPQTRTVTKTINVHPKPNLTITANPSNLLFCNGAGAVNLEAEINGSSLSNFVWITDKAKGVGHKLQAQSSDIDLVPNETTTYTVYATSDNICYLNESITIPVFDLGDDRVFCIDEQLDFDIGDFFSDLGLNANDYSITWTIVEGSTTTTINNFTHYQPGSFADVTTIEVSIIHTASQTCAGNDIIELTPVNCCITPTFAVNEIADGTTLTEFINRYNETIPQPSNPIVQNASGKFIIGAQQNDLQEISVFGKFIIDAKVRMDGINFKMAEGAEIILNPFTTLTARGTGTNKTVFESCGTEMWKGIRVRPEAKLELLPNGILNYSTVIKDAEFAIFVENSSAPSEFESTITLDNAELLNNYIGILVEQKDGTAKNNEHVILDIKESTFDGSSLKGTYYNQITIPGNTGYAGIVANDANIIIDDVSGVPNEFKNLCVGIMSMHGNMSLINNSFENILYNPSYADHGNGTAISSNGDSEIYIDDNEFKTYQSGIRIAGPTKFDIDILNNEFNTGVGTTFDIDDYGYEAIRVEGYIAPLTRETESPCVISNNMIENNAVGIHVRNMNNAEIFDNDYETFISNTDLQTLITNKGWRHYGIWVENSNSTKVLNNDRIFRTSTDASGLTQQDQMRGIAIDQSSNCVVQDNYTNNMGTDIRVMGNCLGTELRCNKMENSFQGMKFDAATIVPSTNLQYGSPTDPTDNRWEGDYLTNMNDRITGTFANVQTGGAIDWYHRNAVAANNEYSPFHHSGIVNPTGISNSPPPVCSLMIVNNDSINQEDLVDIVNDSTDYQEFTEENEYYEDEYAYEEISEDESVLYDGTPDDMYLQQWYTAQQQGNLGKFEELELYIKQKNLQAAHAANMAINDTTIILQNLVDANEIYLNNFFTEDSIVELDSITEAVLYNLAHQNAIQGGTGVYMARAMLGIDVEDAFNVARLSQQNSTEPTFTNHFIIFPNPSTGKYFMECMLEEDANGIFIVRDVLGKVIYSNKLYGGFNNVHFDLKEYKNGIYYYELIVQSITEKSGKLSLIK